MSINISDSYFVWLLKYVQQYYYIAKSDINQLEFGDYKQKNRPKLNLSRTFDGEFAGIVTFDIILPQSCSVFVGGVFLITDDTKYGTKGDIKSVSPFVCGGYTVCRGDTLKIQYTIDCMGVCVN